MTIRTLTHGVHGTISELPGCTQVAVSHNVWTPLHNRGKGNGQKAHRARLKEMELFGFNYAICTVEYNNAAELKILETNGWKVLDNFLSDKTQHRLIIMGKKLNE